MRSLRRYVCVDDKANGICAVNTTEVASMLNNKMYILRMEYIGNGCIQRYTKNYNYHYCGFASPVSSYIMDDMGLYFPSKNVRILICPNPAESVMSYMLTIDIRVQLPLNVRI